MVRGPKWRIRYDRTPQTQYHRDRRARRRETLPEAMNMLSMDKLKNSLLILMVTLLFSCGKVSEYSYPHGNEISRVTRLLGMISRISEHMTEEDFVSLVNGLTSVDSFLNKIGAGHPEYLSEIWGDEFASSSDNDRNIYIFFKSCGEVN